MVYRPARDRSWRSWFSRKRESNFQIARPSVLQRRRSWIGKIVDRIKSEKTVSPNRRELRSINLQQVLLVILLFLIIVLGITLSFSKTFALTEIKIERTDLRVDSSNVDSFLQKYIERNLIWLRLDVVKTDIQQHFPSIAQVEVSRTWPHGLKVTLKSLPIVARVHLIVQPKKEVVLPPRTLDQVSGSGTEIASQKTAPTEEIWMINQFGLLEPNDSQFEKKIPLIYWEIPIDHVPQFGEQLLDQFQLAQIIKIPEILLTEFTLETASISYFSDAKEAHYKTYQYELWISFADDWQEELKKLRTVFLTIGTTKHQYIDLRVKNRIIYK